MCGIAGAIGIIDSTVLAAVAAMTENQRHRGPDDSGLWRSPPSPDQLGVAFGHRRLSILDLSPAGHQPMLDPAAGNAIVFNGEIYNFQQIQQELASNGIHCQSHCDTEVILKSY